MEFFDVNKLMTGAFNPSDKCIPRLLILDQSSFRAFSSSSVVQIPLGQSERFNESWLFLLE